MAMTNVVNTVPPVGVPICPADRSLSPLHVYASWRWKLCGDRISFPLKAFPCRTSRNKTQPALCIPRRHAFFDRHIALRSWHVQPTSRHLVYAVSEVSDPSNVELTFPLQDGLIHRVATCQDANEALGLIEECMGARNPRGTVSMVTCLELIECSLSQGNAALAFAIVEAMRSAGAGIESTRSGEKNLSTLDSRNAGATLRRYGTTL